MKKLAAEDIDEEWAEHQIFIAVEYHADKRKACDVGEHTFVADKFFNEINRNDKNPDAVCYICSKCCAFLLF